MKSRIFNIALLFYLLAVVSFPTLADEENPYLYILGVAQDAGFSTRITDREIIGIGLEPGRDSGGQRFGIHIGHILKIRIAQAGRKSAVHMGAGLVRVTDIHSQIEISSPDDHFYPLILPA